MAVSELSSILFLSLITALISEALSSLLIFRSPDYLQLKDTLAKLQQKKDGKKGKREEVKGGKKETDRLEEAIKSTNSVCILATFWDI